MVRAEPEQALITAGLALAYVGFMLVVVRPLLLRFVRRYESGVLSQNAFAVICVALLCSALVTELIGIHALFGAFLLGAMIPHDARLSSQRASFRVLQQPRLFPDVAV